MDGHDITKAVIDELTRECASLTAERDAALARAEEAERERDALRDVLREMIIAMSAYEMDVDESPPYRHRAMMDRARAALKDTD